MFNSYVCMFTRGYLKHQLLQDWASRQFFFLGTKNMTTPLAGREIKVETHTLFLLIKVYCWTSNVCRTMMNYGTIHCLVKLIRFIASITIPRCLSSPIQDLGVCRTCLGRQAETASSRSSVVDRETIGFSPKLWMVHWWFMMVHTIDL